MTDPLVVVSNRGPIGYQRSASGELTTARGAGGLVTALRPLVDRGHVTWVASAMGDVERELAREGRRDERSAAGTPFRLRLVTHDPEVYRQYYGVVANPVLWFVQHRLWDLKRDPNADLTAPWRDGYVAANRALADAAVEELDHAPGALLYVHDYHLYLVPSLVRERRPSARIAFFVHIPWVGPDDWGSLPRGIAQSIHEGLLACDSVGFHTERWRSAFVASCGWMTRSTCSSAITPAASSGATSAHRTSPADPSSATSPNDSPRRSCSPRRRWCSRRSSAFRSASRARAGLAAGSTVCR